MPSWAVGLDRNKRFSDDPFLFFKSVGDILNMHLNFKCTYSECRQLLLGCQQSIRLEVAEMIFYV